MTGLLYTTFSITARCPRTGMLGVAVATKLPAVGALCPHACAGAGAIATQSLVNPFLGLRGLELLRQGVPAQEALERVLADDAGRELRQVSVVDRHGATAVFTGGKCEGWHGHRMGAGYVAAGNFLVGEEVVASMAEAFATSEHEELPERLVRALEAAQAAGGDKRGKQSAEEIRAMARRRQQATGGSHP